MLGKAAVCEAKMKRLAWNQRIVVRLFIRQEYDKNSPQNIDLTFEIFQY